MLNGEGKQFLTSTQNKIRGKMNKKTYKQQKGLEKCYIYKTLIMEKDTSKTPASLLVTALQNRGNKDQNIVIPDECGDTLWDKVLEQEEKKEKDTGFGVKENND